MSAKKVEDTSKEKALENAIKQISKEFGEGSIMKLGENLSMNIEVIPTGSINLDLALGVKGVPRGRVIEVYGAESSGKTTIALHIVAEAQKNGGVAAFIDAEHALDPVYAKALGVDVEELLISQPDYGEQALEIADLLVRSNAVDIIVVDSVAALVPKVEIDGEMSDQQMGLQARLMSKALRKLTATLNKSKTTMIFINQIRDKIGGFGFGPQTTTTGGKALKFYASVRMEVKRVGQVKQGDEVIGNETLVKITKNKVAPPFKEASFQIMYGKGISKVGEVLDIALDNDIVQKSGAWFSFGDIRLGQGKENVKTRLENEKELFEEIERKVLEIIEEDQNKITLNKKNLDDTSEEESIISEGYDEVSEEMDNVDEI
ncbi:recombinase RecA [uncultured Fusobacterium sp.]|mgnify:FL=1|jgi:recombination protein RecA|uniref:recombinase RecA n=1 Tax=uncultured Fusobacterium sp. TaxID=159267 RepID=UPI00265F4725|nr:recombinase RecA [uncultured Fusobacterium sp.]